jgi:C1A family cysteine protease
MAKSSKFVKNIVRSKDQQDDWQMTKAKRLGLSPKKKPVPSTVDLRAGWWKVGDQGSTGACVGWATADSLLRYHFTKAKKIKEGEHMSVRFIWMASKEMDEYADYPTTFIDDSGTSLKSALKVVRKFGALKAAHLPFDGHLVKLKEHNYLKTAGKYKIKAYFNLARKKSEKIKLFKEWLAFHGPILTCLDCDSSWNDVKSDGKLIKYDKKNVDGGHAMSIVGYTPDHFIIRNSWGTGWGHKGYAYASYEYTLDAFNEAYGIVL